MCYLFQTSSYAPRGLSLKEAGVEFNNSIFKKDFLEAIFLGRFVVPSPKIVITGREGQKKDPLKLPKIKNSIGSVVNA